ncbi:MAG: glycosyltransferase [Treponemataceae bacterium]|nr:glycosyltransferase [Treponemataceae bacterium]
MNIALFSDCYLPSKNGVVTVIEQLRESLTKQGHHVVVVTVKNEQETEEMPNIYRAVAVPAGMGMKDQFFGFPWLPKVIKYLKRNNIELIHCHTEFTIGITGIQAAHRLHIPLVATMHTMWDDYYKFYLPAGKHIPLAFIQRLTLLFYNRFNAAVGVSTKAYNHLKKTLEARVPALIIPNAMDANKFSSSSVNENDKKNLREKLGIKDTDFVCLFVGRIGEEKRIYELIRASSRAVKQNNKIKLLFIGDGPAMVLCQESVEEKGIKDNVIFTGFLEWKELHSYYSIADLFMTASLSEMHSMTILESLITGLPIVARDDSSFYDTIHHGENGFLASTDDEITDYILKLASDKDLKEQFSKKSLELSRSYTPDLFVKKYLALYKYVLEHKKKNINEAELQVIIEEVGKTQ